MLSVDKVDLVIKTPTPKPCKQKTLKENKSPKSQSSKPVNPPKSLKPTTVVTEDHHETGPAQPRTRQPQPSHDVRIVHISGGSPRECIEKLREINPDGQFLLYFQKKCSKISDKVQSELLRKYQEFLAENLNKDYFLLGHLKSFMAAKNIQKEDALREAGNTLQKLTKSLLKHNEQFMKVNTDVISSALALQKKTNACSNKLKKSVIETQTLFSEIQESFKFREKCNRRTLKRIFRYFLP